jgi:hypothetical protein
LSVGADGCRSCTARAWSSRKCARGWRTCSRSICRSARRSTIRLHGRSTSGVSGEPEAGRAHAHGHNRSPAAADMDGGVRGGDRRLGEEDAVLDALPRSGDAPGCTSAFDCCSAGMCADEGRCAGQVPELASEHVRRLRRPPGVLPIHQPGNRVRVSKVGPVSSG